MTIDEAYAFCRGIAHKRGANFSVGFRFLPRTKRRAVYAAYAYCRWADDTVGRLAARARRLLRRRTNASDHDRARGCLEALRNSEERVRRAHRRLPAGHGQIALRRLRRAVALLRARRGIDLRHLALDLR